MTAAAATLEPVTLGPTWARNADGSWVLPTRTLGWQALAWTAAYLRQPDGPNAGDPWSFTDEQARLLLWWYAVDDVGRFLYRYGVLQRLKGWGKDPFGGALAAVEFVGPSRFAGWDANGDPVGKPHPAAWVQTAAVSKEQTKNTMTLFPGLFSDDAIDEYKIDLGKEIIYAHRGRCRIEAVTSSPRALEGARSTFVLKNETHHWIASNEGHDMSAVVDRNIVKSRDGAARALAITNAYEPGEDSVAERERDAYTAIVEGRSRAKRFLYDSLEAPPTVELADEPKLRQALELVRGDSVWLDIDNLVEAIYDPRTPPSQSRRFYLNVVTAAEDAWIAPEDFDACADADRVVDDRERIVAFLDGSKSDDATGLVGCRLSDGHVFTLGVWQKPAGPRGDGWVVPLEAVDVAVDAMFDRFEVVAFWADPSDTRDDVGERFWEPTLDDWHLRYGAQLDKEFHAVKHGASKHSIAWDMRSPDHLREFTAAAMRTVAEIESSARAAREDKPEARTFTHSGDRPLRTHAVNARRMPNRYGVALGKENRESQRKVDLAVCAVGARMLRRVVLNSGAGKRRRSGKVW